MTTQERPDRPRKTGSPVRPRSRHGPIGVPVNFVSPNRLAEEYAMLDVISGGRLEIAFPLGTGMEYWGNSASIRRPPARSSANRSTS